jgi:hypothetical protein
MLHTRSKYIYQAFMLEWTGLSCGEEALLPAPVDPPDGQNTTCGACGALGAFIYVYYIDHPRDQAGQ